MFSFILRPKAFRHSLPLSAFLLAVTHPSRAQSAPKPLLNEGESPQLTLGVRPASAIANSPRAAAKILPRRISHSLLLALPEPKTPKVWKVSVQTSRTSDVVVPKIRPELKTNEGSSAVAKSDASKPATREALVTVAAPETGGTLSRSATPETEIALARPVKVTAKSRFAASRVTAQVARPADGNPVAVGAVATPKPKAASILVAAVPRDSSPTNSSPDSSPFDARSRGVRLPSRGVRLPSRGGLMRSVPIEVRPPAPDTTRLNASQLRILAQLDSKLGVAQRRLDRAETRLSEGQRQLGSFNGVLRSAMLDAGDDARGLHPFVRVAQRYMGTPYVWGGESARGFDCSGFIMRVMRDLGYRALPHSAAEQFRYGMPIAKPLLKAGDVVFFANTYKPGISHVGIYLGRGRFIHAANSKDGTIVSNLESPKWVEHYAGARRLLPVNER